MKAKIRKITAVLLVVVMTLSVVCAGTVSIGAADGYENIETTLPDARTELEEYVNAVSFIDFLPAEYWYQFYEEEAFDAYVATVEKAKALLADENATDEEIEAMLDEIYIADNMLNEAVKIRSVLELMIENSSMITDAPIEELYELYGQGSVDAYLAALEKAKALLADENATDEELRAMVEELQAASDNLMPSYDPRTELEELLLSCSRDFENTPEYWYNYYTKESYDAYLAAKQKADKLLADENTTDEEFEAMIEEFLTARENLVRVEDINRPEPSFSGGKIYWECPWSKVKVAYCHVFSSDGDWLYDWQTKNEKMTKESGNLWSYEIPAGAYDLVIFSIDTGAQTYDLVLTDENIGDTAISDLNEILENPMDENKTVPKTIWKSGVNGAHLTITSTGNIVGDVLCPTESGPNAVANFIEAYLPIEPLYVTSETLKNAMNKFGTNQAEVVDVLEGNLFIEPELIDEAKSLLGYVEGVMGDVTGDGKVKLTDAICVQKASLSMKSLTPKTALTGDVNGDDKISVIDAIIIQKKSLGMTA